MRLRRLLRIPPKYGVITLLVTVVAWNEYLDIKFRSLTWIKPSKTDKDFSILLIADPQLIGYRNEPYFIGWLSRWDADRYPCLINHKPTFLNFQIFEERVC